MLCSIQIEEGKDKKKIYDFLEQASRAGSSVGWFDEKNANKAYINEFGGVKRGHTGKKVVIPPRPFINPSITKISSMKTLGGFKENIRKNGIIFAFLQLGEYFKEIMTTSINRVWNPPLADLTIKLREQRGVYVEGVDKPLVETGEMRDSIEVKVIK